MTKEEEKKRIDELIAKMLEETKREESLVDTNIPVDWYYQYAFCQMAKYTGISSDPDKNGPVYQNKLGSKGTIVERRFPEPEKYNGAQSIGGNVRYIETGPSQTVEIVVYHNLDLFHLSANPRLFVIQPNSRVDFNIDKFHSTDGKISVRVINTVDFVGLLNPASLLINDVLDGRLDGYATLDVTGKEGFILRKGSIKEDTDFKAARELDDAMEFYACCADGVSSLIRKEVDAMKKNVAEVQAASSPRPI